MGSSQSSQNDTAIDILNQTMTTLVTNNISTGNATTVNANRLKINLEGATISNCNMNIQQNITADQTVQVMAKFTSTADLQAQMNTVMQDKVNQTNGSQQGALVAALNVQSTKASINERIQNIVNTSITNNTLNSVNGFLDNVNQNTLNMKGVTYTCTNGEGGITLLQNIISKQTASLLADTIISAVSSTSISSQASSDSDQGNTSKQEGIIDAFSGVIKAFSSFFTGPLMVIGIIIILMAVLAYVFRGSISKIAEKKAGVSFGKRRYRRRR